MKSGRQETLCSEMDQVLSPLEVGHPQSSSIYDTQSISNISSLIILKVIVQCDIFLSILVEIHLCSEIAILRSQLSVFSLDLHRFAVCVSDWIYVPGRMPDIAISVILAPVPRHEISHRWRQSPRIQ